MDCGPDGKAYRRLNAMHLLLLGVDYKLVLRNSRVCERTFRLWIERFNQQGIDGLIYKPQPGRPRKITPDQVASNSARGGRSLLGQSNPLDGDQTLRLAV